jgi:hypothetical protein
MFHIQDQSLFIKNDLIKMGHSYYFTEYQDQLSFGTFKIEEYRYKTIYIKNFNHNAIRLMKIEAEILELKLISIQIKK